MLKNKLDMKKIVLFSILLAVAGTPLAAQDTVRQADPWYSSEAHNRLTQIINIGLDANAFFYRYSGSWPGNEYYTVQRVWDDFFKMCVPQTNENYLYGIAVTAYNFPVHVEGMDMDPIMGLYVLNDDSSMWAWTPVRIYDSLTPTNVRRDCYFDYELGTPEKPDSHIVVPTTELYFDTPYHRDSLPDTLFLSLNWTDERKQRYKDWVASHCSSADSMDCMMQPVVAWGQSLPTSLCFGTPLWFSDVIELWDSNYYDTGWNPSDPNIINLDYSYNRVALQQLSPTGYPSARAFWGCIFPIKNLRCTAPRLHLAGRETDAATVIWSQAEAGEAYQLSLATYSLIPDSGMLVTPTDTFHTFTGLHPDTIYHAWVRKACRYTTAGSDTLVWSDWSHPLTFRASVGIDEVDANGLRVTAQGGRIAVQGLAAGERAEVFDMKGCRVATLENNGCTLPLPQGVYMLRTQPSHRHRRVVVTR